MPDPEEPPRLGTIDVVSASLSSGQQRWSIAPASDGRGVRLYTVGHSTRSLDELVALLRSFEVSILADVRTVPRSRHNPQFNREALRSALRRRRLRYVHLPALGGLRHARRDSPNTGWRNAGFRGFADYMLTPDFEAGLAELRALAAEGTVALMCAEAVPWRCHRSLIADALTVRGARVEHITAAGRAFPHRLTPFAQVEGLHITYPGDGASPLETRAPLHFEATVRVLQRRPSNLVDVWDDGTYRRLLSTRAGPSLVEVTNRGSVDAPDVRLRMVAGETSEAALADASRTMRRVLGLDLDPGPLHRLAEKERALGPLATALRGMRPPRFTGLFETVMNVVPFQQMSLDSGVATVRRLVERFGSVLEHAGRRHHAAPDAEAVAGARLDAIRRCGLSRAKAETLRGVARKIRSGQLSEERLAEMPSPEAIRSLTELPGIGPWSANVILLRGLGRLDVFPPGDVGAQRGLRALLHLRPGATLGPILDRFGDRRGYLYFFALGGALLARGLIHPASRPPAP